MRMRVTDSQGRPIFQSPKFWVPFFVSFFFFLFLTIVTTPGIVLGVLILGLGVLVVYDRHLDHKIKDTEEEIRHLEEELPANPTRHVRPSNWSTR